MTYVKTGIYCFIFFVCLNATKSYSQTSAFSREKYIDVSGDTLNYRMLFPDWDSLRKYPLVIFLHGIGERGSDNESQLKFGIMDLAQDKISSIYPAFIIAPQCPENMRWANNSENDVTHQIHALPSPSEPMNLLIELIKNLRKTFLLIPIESISPVFRWAAMEPMMQLNDIQTCLQQQFRFAVEATHQKLLL